LTAANIQTLEVDGGPGNDSFVTDGSIPNTVLVGGSGSNTTNTFTVTGGNDELMGGSGTNTFTLVGKGTYSVVGGSGANALVIQDDDNGGETDLAQDGSTITAGWKSLSLPPTLYLAGITATNMTSVSVMGGAGNDKLDASGMIMGVT